MSLLTNTGCSCFLPRVTILCHNAIERWHEAVAETAQVTSRQQVSRDALIVMMCANVDQNNISLTMAKSTTFTNKWGNTIYNIRHADWLLHAALGGWIPATINEKLVAGAIYKPRCSSYCLRRQIFVENRDFSLPHLHSMPPSEYRRPVSYVKTRMVWLPDSEKIFEDIFIRFDRMYEHDRHTPRDGIGHACIALRRKNST